MRSSADREMYLSALLNDNFNNVESRAKASGSITQMIIVIILYYFTFSADDEIKGVFSFPRKVA